ncbi:MAG: glycosyltransferase family 4 protein [Prevotella sp.]|nr:glycosyltransferase family 4 protein [Prevotella sp.]
MLIMDKRLFIFANLGNLQKVARSGGQTSARRVMDGLSKLGYTTIPIVKHRSEMKGTWAHQFEIFTFAFIDLLKIIFTLAFKSRKNSAFMMLTYAGSLVPFEWLISKTVRGLGFKSIYYLKGGKLMDTYPTGSNRHKQLFKETMDMQELVFFEGIASLGIVKAISDTPLAFFPNYIADNLMDEKGVIRSKETINILYFGRIAPEKNIHICIESFNILCGKYHNMRLTIIGGYTRAVEYGKKIEKLIQDSPNKDKIEWIGNSPFEVIKEKMKTHHFFLFPTHEKAEGHSNSLTEAMSQGLIPIVSDWHFNKAIVGNERLVVDGYAPQSYAKVMDDIISRQEIDVLSEQMRSRIKAKFLESVVLQDVRGSLMKVFV